MSEKPTYEELEQRVLEFEKADSKRKQVEHTLRESESLLSSIFRAAPTGIGVVSNRILLAVNDRVCDMIGYSREEMIGQSARMLYPSNAHFENVGTEKYRQILQYGTGTVETQWQCKDGRIIDILMSSAPINPLDLAAGVTFTALDITERKKAEGALRESEERFRKLFQKHSAVKLIIDPETGNIIDANEAAANFYGSSIDEIRQMRIQQINTLPHEAVKTNMEKTLSSECARYEFRHRRADGSIRDVEVFSNKIDMAGKSFLYSIVHDISERVKAEEALLQEYAFRNVIIDHVAEGLCVCHETKEYPFVKFTIWNERMTEITGYTLEEINRLGWYQTVYPDPDLRIKATERMQRMRQRNDLRAEEWEIIRADGSKRVLNISTSVVESGDGSVHVLALMQDITERKQTEEALRLSEEKFALAFANNLAAIALSRLEDGLFLDVNDTWVAMSGYSRDDVIGQSARKLNIWPTTEAAAKFVQELREKGTLHGWEQEFFRKSGEIYVTQLSATVLTIKGEKLILSTLVDITERKRAEDALLRAKEEWELTFNCVPDLIAILDDHHRILRTNRAMANRLGCTSEHCIGLGCYASVHGTAAPPEFCPHAQAMADGREHMAEVYEERLGGFFLVSATPLFDDQGKLIGSVHVARDITERKHQEVRLQKLNRTLMALSHGREVMLRATDETKYLEEICDIIVKDCGHTMVWIGYAEDDVAKSVRPMVSCGFDAGYIESLGITWADTERGRGPTGTAIRTGRVSTCVNMKIDPNFTPWCEDSIKRGYASSLALPLMADGRCFGAISIYSGEPDAFSEDEIELLTELADDLAFGIMSLRLRIERARSEDSLRSLLSEKEVLLKEVHHRVKNNLQVISSLISLQSESFHEEQMQLIFSDLRNRVQSIALVHEKLYLSNDLAKLNFAQYANSLLKYLWRAGVTTAHNVRLNLSLEPLMLTIDSAVHCGLILNELITNTLKYAFPNGREGEVSVSLEHDSATGAVCLRVSDNGVGLPADFDLRQSNSLGLRLVQMLAGQMRGSVQTGPGPGTEFQISFKVKGSSS